MRSRLHPLIAALIVAPLLGACNASPEPSWFPLNTGARWEYQVDTDIDGTTRHDTQSVQVIGNRPLNGRTVYTRRAEMSDNVGIEYLLQVSDSAITRIAQRTDLQDLPVADETPRTVLKLPLRVGATWLAPTVAYTVLRKAEFPRELKYARTLQMTYTVEAMDEEVEVPAGRFKQCARIGGRADLTVYADPVNGFRKIPLTTTEWYCKDVGLVKLVRIENLESSFFSGGKIEMRLTDFKVR
ncbi:MAG: hypothetical protein H7327_14210 [Herminiimonas sp.]|nr:hypothetical protein [Herminiimonas sp.]